MENMHDWLMNVSYAVFAPLRLCKAKLQRSRVHFTENGSFSNRSGDPRVSYFLFCSRHNVDLEERSPVQRTGNLGRQ